MFVEAHPNLDIDPRLTLLAASFRSCNLRLLASVVIQASYGGTPSKISILDSHYLRPHSSHANFVYTRQSWFKRLMEAHLQRYRSSTHITCGLIRVMQTSSTRVSCGSSVLWRHTFEDTASCKLDLQFGIFAASDQGPRHRLNL
jgi:hypothetical protein